MDHGDVARWVDSYERAWRSPGTDQVDRLFSDEATYLVSPWAEPFRGIEAIRDLWDSEDDAGRSFTMTSEVVAVDGDVAVVRVEVEYAVSGDRWRDLWVLRFGEDGRCSHFEEWPFAPGQPDGQ